MTPVPRISTLGYHKGPVLGYLKQRLSKFFFILDELFSSFVQFFFFLFSSHSDQRSQKSESQGPCRKKLTKDNTSVEKLGIWPRLCLYQILVFFFLNGVHFKNYFESSTHDRQREKRSIDLKMKTFHKRVKIRKEMLVLNKPNTQIGPMGP